MCPADGAISVSNHFQHIFIQYSPSLKDRKGACTYRTRQDEGRVRPDQTETQQNLLKGPNRVGVEMRGQVKPIRLIIRRLHQIKGKDDRQETGFQNKSINADCDHDRRGIRKRSLISAGLSLPLRRRLD